MKTRIYLPLFAFLFAAGACKKDPLTRPVEFTATSYQALAPFDSLGRPSNLLPRDTISASLQSYIKTTLVEQTDLRTTHPELLATNAIADIVITKSSDVFVTFVSQLTASTNALAFYTYPTNNPPTDPKDIKTITYMFPSAGSGTKLKPGDKVKLGRFETGTSIGFVLLKNAWNATTGTIEKDVIHFCSNDILNPEVDPALRKHAVLINYPQENKVLIGFENTDRTNERCDHDFNDIVIYATVVSS